MDKIDIMNELGIVPSIDETAQKICENLGKLETALHIIQYCRGTKKTISKEELDDNLFEVEKILYEYLKEDNIG